MKKIGIYTPYLDSFGGGERYILTIAETFLPDHQVDLFLDQHLKSLDVGNLIVDLSKRLHLNLNGLNLVSAPLGQGSNFLDRVRFLHQYDFVFCLTDGSIFYSTAHYNIIHFQVPFQNISPRNLWDKRKISTWDLAIYNSEFTRGYIEKQIKIKGKVIYPPVDIGSIKFLKKKKNILSVGRFASFSRSKKHEVMIKTFIEMCKSESVKDWSLHLAGSVEGDENYLDELKKLAGDSPVHFYPNLAFDKLMELYGQSSIYWHAAGFGETDPAKMEHFGITTVEAMTGGCVPVVINLGGQKEIVKDGKTGFLWDNLDELKEKTLVLIKNDELRTKMAALGNEQSERFSKERFKKEVNELIYGSN